MALYDFYFAWVANGGVAFNAAVHNVHDEAVLGMEIEHQEKEIPHMRIMVENPKVGLLNPGRMQWAWVSWRKPDNTVVALFHGRLVGMPTELTGPVVALEFTARPADYDAQKAALAAGMRTLGANWDPVFIDETQLTDPDVVLAARSVLYHVGRTDKTVSVSDILNGEAGSVVLSPAEVLGRRCDIQYGQPVDKVKVTASVEWTQSAFGSVDMSQAIKNEFGGAVSSYTGQGLEATWPPFGTEIGAGWSVDVSLPRLLNTSVNKSHQMKVKLNPANDTPDFEIEDWWADSPQGFEYHYQLAYQEWLNERLLDPVTEARFVRWDFNPVMTVRYEANRRRKETLSFTVTADLQRLTTQHEEPLQEINVTSTTVDQVLPTSKARSYFETDRGQISIGYLLNLARSQILMQARAVQITVDIPWLIGIALSCKHDIVLALDELPGGEAGGKVVGYSLAVDPQAGTMSASVTFAAVVGAGNTLGAPDPGEESYVDDDYVEDEYQVFYGESLQPVAGQIQYTRPTYKPNDDDINFNDMRAATVLEDIAATALYTFTGPGADGETVVIGPRTYTLRNVANDPNEVLIGGVADATAQNLASAIERNEAQEGVTFGAGTLAHATVGATVAGAILRATARAGGTAGNAIAVSDTSAAGSWDHATLQGGSDGLVVLNPPAVQEAHMDAGNDPGSVRMAIDKLNEVPTKVQMALKSVTGGPFETDIALVTSELMVPSTIDLSAAPL